MDLLAVGDQGVAGQRIEVLVARQLSDAPDCAVDRAQPTTVALAPDHPFVVGRHDLAAALQQGAVGVEQQLRVVQRSTVALVDTDRYDHACRTGGLGDRVDRRRRDRHGLVEEPQVLRSHLEGALDEREVRVVGDHRFRERRELHVAACQLRDLADHLFHGALATVKDGAELHCGGADYVHRPVS